MIPPYATMRYILQLHYSINQLRAAMPYVRRLPESDRGPYLQGQLLLVQKKKPPRWLDASSLCAASAFCVSSAPAAQQKQLHSTHLPVLLVLQREEVLLSLYVFEASVSDEPASADHVSALAEHALWELLVCQHQSCTGRSRA
jgi:hypothetical protein